jgi:hypothetical protein
MRILSLQVNIIRSPWLCLIPKATVTVQCFVYAGGLAKQEITYHNICFQVHRYGHFAA